MLYYNCKEEEILKGGEENEKRQKETHHYGNCRFDNQSNRCRGCRDFSNQVVVTKPRGESPSPFGGQSYINTKKGEIQVRNKNYLFIILCLMLVIANSNNFDIFSRIAVGATGILIMLDVIKDARRLING